MNITLTSVQKLDVLQTVTRTDADYCSFLMKLAAHLGIRPYEAMDLYALAVDYNMNPDSYA